MLRVAQKRNEHSLQLAKERMESEDIAKLSKELLVPLHSWRAGILQGSIS